MSAVLIVLLSIIILGIISVIGYFAYKKLGKDTTSGSPTSGSPTSGSPTSGTTSGTPSRTTTSGTSSGTTPSRTTSGTGNSLLNITVRNESNTSGTTPSGTTPSGTTTSGTTTSGTTTSGTTPPPPPSPYKRVECQSQDNPSEFCSSPNSFINICQGSTLTSSDTYVRSMQDCIKNNYNRIDENEYNSARELLISEEPKYGDATYQFYIPPYIKNINCEDQTQLNLFCQKPSDYMDVCAITSRYGPSDTDKIYSDKLRSCLKDGYIRPEQTSKDNYEKARQKLIAKNSKFGNPSDISFFVPPYIQGVDCSQESESTRFCRRPNEYMDVCQVINRVADETYARKLRSCLKDDFQAIGSDQTTKDNFEKARQKLITKDSKFGNPSDISFFVPAYSENIDCSQNNDMHNFCMKPYEFIQGCSVFTNSDDISIIRKLQDCALNRPRTLGIDSYRRARAIYVAKNPDYGKRTSQLNIPYMNINTNYTSLIQKMNINI